MDGPNYLAEAFKLKGNLVFLAGGVVASAVLGSGVALGIVAGMEALYLASMSTNPRFRRAIRAIRR